MHHDNTPTDLQEIVDAVKIKIPTEDLTGKEDKLIQLLKYAISRCYRKTYDESLEFEYDELTKEGSFLYYVCQPTIELLSLYIVKEYFSWELLVLGNRLKYHVGTNAFNKLPNDSNKDRYNFLTERLNYWTNEIIRFEAEFPDYSEER